MKSLLDRITDWLNLRTLAVILGGLMLVSPAAGPLGWLDDRLLAIGSRLAVVPGDDTDVSVVNLPGEEIGYLASDPASATRTLALLEQLLAREGTYVGLLLDRPVDLRPGLVPGGADQLAVLQRFWAQVSHPRLVVGKRGSEAALPPNPETVISSPGWASDYLRWLPSRLKPGLPVVDLLAGPVPTGEALFWPVQTRRRAIPLLYQNGEQVQAGFLLELYRRYQQTRQVEWQQFVSLTLATHSLPVSPNGEILPYVPSRYPASTLSDALATQPPQNVVLLNGMAGSSAGVLADTLARGFIAMNQLNYLYTPAWFVLAKIGLFGIAILYLVLGLARLSSSAGVFATSLLLVLVVVSQLGWQLVQKQWLPLGMLLQYLCLGHLLIFFWRRQKERALNLVAATHGARYQLGLQLFRDGRAEDALVVIRECRTSEAVLGLMYDIATQLERKRHYPAAVKTYQSIVARQKHFRDAQQKVETLISYSSGGAAGLLGGGDMAKTLMVSETTINKPVLGRYEIERELGRGAMGIVYLGRDPKISRQVAIKTLSYGQFNPAQLDEFKDRFFREAEAAGRLNHPNIVTIYDVGEEHDLAFIAMDYVEGDSLAANTGKNQLLPPAECFRIIATVADALAYAHEKNIIHRDIKPGNIMYQPQNATIKVADFGVARIVDNAKTNTGDILGSPLYMSPEQLQGNKVDFRTDIYSLGVTLYQLLTGVLPFDGDNLANLTYKIINEKHKGVREHKPALPGAITRIINRAMHKDPRKRYASASDLARALRALV